MAGHVVFQTGNIKCGTVSVGVQTESFGQNAEPFNRHHTFKSERDDDCRIVFDSIASKSCQIISQETAGMQDSSEYILNGTSNAACNDGECSIIFDSNLEAPSVNRKGTGNSSLNNCSSESARNVYSIDSQVELDRQTMQILAAREMAKCKLDVDEVVLDFEPSPLHQLWCRTDGIPAATRRELISQGIIRLGKWSKREDKILLRNYYNFVEKYDIDNPVLLIGLYGCSWKGNMQKFRRAKKFYFQLGRDLNDRPIRSIYARARHLLDSWNYKGKFSKEEIKKLIALQKEVGNQWGTIALHLKRPSLACKVACGYFSKNFRSGQWTPQEDAMLLKAIRRHVGKTKLLSKFHGYPWKAIAKDVPSRNFTQCRHRWLESLCWKLRSVDQPKWKRTDSALLIYLLYSNIVEEECFIDWDFLYDKFKASVPSYVPLQRHWYWLKSKVPCHADKDHESIVMYLYKNYLPKILKKCSISESDLKDMMNQNTQVLKALPCKKQPV